ncbi:hypothetical protein GUITHDRAFT_153327, partial [Guillardia theta CCMP2712]
HRGTVPSGTAVSPSSSMSFISIIQTFRTQLDLPPELSCEDVLRAAYPLKVCWPDYHTPPNQQLSRVGLWPAAQWLANKFFGPSSIPSNEQVEAPIQSALPQARGSPATISFNVEAAITSPSAAAVTHDTSDSHGFDLASPFIGSDSESEPDLDLTADAPVYADSAADLDHGGCSFTRRAACFKDRPLRDHAALLQKECTGYIERINLEHGCRGIRTVDPGRHYFYNIVCQCSSCPYFLRIHLTQTANSSTTNYWIVDCSK